MRAVVDAPAPVVVGPLDDGVESLGRDPRVGVLGDELPGCAGARRRCRCRGRTRDRANCSRGLLVARHSRGGERRRADHDLVHVAALGAVARPVALADVVGASGDVVGERHGTGGDGGTVLVDRRCVRSATECVCHSDRDEYQSHADRRDQRRKRSPECDIPSRQPETLPQAHLCLIKPSASAKPREEEIVPDADEDHRDPQQNDRPTRGVLAYDRVWIWHQITRPSGCRRGPASGHGCASAKMSTTSARGDVARRSINSLCSDRHGRCRTRHVAVEHPL